MKLLAEYSVPNKTLVFYEFNDEHLEIFAQTAAVAEHTHIFFEIDVELVIV